MNTIGIALVWCVAQVTLIGALVAGLYLVVRRLRPAAAASVVFTGLAIVVVLSLMAASPWPRWTIHQSSPLPLREGPGLSAAGLDNAPSPADLRSMSDEGREATASGDESVPVKSQPSVAALLWQSLLDELAKPQPAVSTNTWHWPAIVAALFFATMAFGLGWLLLGVLTVRRERLRSRPVLDRELLELVDVLCAELGCRRPVEVRQSDNLATAATIGWRRPVLLLPADWTTWTADQRRAVLAHEIAHARSHDFLTLLLGQLGLVLHFYHPLLHWLMNRLRLEQELAADAAAASVSGGQWKYLTTIAELALHQQDRPLLWPARTFLPTQTTFLRRIAMLRNSKLRFDRLSLAARLMTVGAVLLCGLLVAGLRGPSGSISALGADTEKPAAMDNSIEATDIIEGIDATYMIEDASTIIAVQPAVFGRPEFAVIAKMLEASGNMVPKGTHLADLYQITLILPNADIASGLREVLVLQWLRPGANAYFAKQVADNRYTVKEYDGKKMYVRSEGGTIILQYDDHTIIQAGSEHAMRVYLAGKRGVLPKWLPAKAWLAFRNDHWLFAAETAMMRREMKGLMEHSPPVVQAAFASVAPVWQDTTALAAGGRLDNRLAVHAWAATNNADSSEKLRRTAEALKTLVQSAVKNARTTVHAGERPDRAAILMMLDVADRLLDNMKFQQDGNEVRLETSAEFDKARLSVLMSSMAPAGERMQAQNNMREIALAIHNYANVYRHFPPAVLYGPDGKTPYSWRVALLPYLEGGELYKQYHFDEPWDGPNNRKLLEKMPAVFRTPNEAAESKNSSYFALVGPGAIFDTRPRKMLHGAPAAAGGGGMGGPAPAAGGAVPDWWPPGAPSGATFGEITDGLSYTILLVEAKRNIPWTKPEDISYDPDKPLPKLGGYFEGGFIAAMADGSVHFLSSTASEKTLRLLITKADRQPVRIEDAMPKAQPAQPPAAAPTGKKSTAIALLRVAMPQALDRDRYEIYKNTQRQLLTSAFVLRAALQNPEVAKLPSVKQAAAAGDVINWLMSQLQVSFPGKAEVMQVTLSNVDPKEAATLVNVVVNTYLKEVVNADRDHMRARLKELDQLYAAKEEELKKLAEQSKTSDNKATDIRNSDPLLRQITMERDKLKVNLRVPPRVTLLQKAEVPETRNKF